MQRGVKNLNSSTKPNDMSKLKPSETGKRSHVAHQRLVGARQKPTLKQMVEAATAAGASVSIGLKHRLLYDAACEQRHTYTFKINGGGELGVKESGQVTITFKDGRFESASFPFSGTYTRNGWRILADIESKICDIENVGRECPNAEVSASARENPKV